MDVSGWISELQREGQDSYGAYEFPLGAAVILGYLLLTVLGRAPWWAVFLYAVLGIVALGYGHRLETKQLKEAGRRRVRPTLLLRITWIVALWCLLWVLVLLGVASVRGWTRMEGWHTGAVALGMMVGLYGLCFGIKNQLLRVSCTGGALILWSVLLPALPILRPFAFPANAILVGGTLLLSGFLGRRSLKAYIAARRS